MTKTQRVFEPADFGTVAVVMGGPSAEREISLLSGRAVLAALRRRGIDADGVEVDDHPLSALQARDFDRVFNIVHGRGGEDGVLQGVLEALAVPYTGSRVLGSALSMDKLKTKICWNGAGIPTPGWRILHSDGDIQSCAEELGFPVIVKPALEGSSLGISRANNADELKAARGSGYSGQKFGAGPAPFRTISGDMRTWHTGFGMNATRCRSVYHLQTLR